MKIEFKSAVASVVFATFAATGHARDTVQIAGSSTVLPFASIVAEEFGQTFPQFPSPVVGSGGTGGGMRQFCQGVGENTIDIVNASRPMKAAEVERCHQAGVKNILQVQIGYDGIVFASRAEKPAFSLEPRHIFAAIARQVPQNGKMVKNSYTRWSQIDAGLPDQPIVVVIPASNHGTREVFEEKVLHTGCSAYDNINKMPEADRAKACTALRQDGRVIEISGDYTETLARLETDKNAVGVFGLGFYEQNLDKLRVARVNGIVPSVETIVSGEYPVSRPLFFYVKGEHIGAVPGLQEYAEYFLAEPVSGAGSQLEETGLIPLSAGLRARNLADLKAGKVFVAQ